MIRATRLIYDAAAWPPTKGDTPGQCRVCGLDGQGELFHKWVRNTFTDHDKLHPGTIICHACAFTMKELSHEMAVKVGKWWADDAAALAANEDRVKKWRKDNKTDALPTPQQIKLVAGLGGWCLPQKARNYSHFIKGGEWYALSKGDKAAMLELLTTPPFPELAVIAESGQKHIIFRATVNAADAAAGYVQFEEQTVWVEPGQLLAVIQIVESLYTGFSKSHIETGDYPPALMVRFGIGWWLPLENAAANWRGSVLFRMALFLAQKGDVDSGRDNIGTVERTDRAELAGGRTARVEPGGKTGRVTPAPSPQGIQQLGLGI